MCLGAFFGGDGGIRTHFSQSTRGLKNARNPEKWAFLKISPRHCTPPKVQKSYKQSYICTVSLQTFKCQIYDVRSLFQLTAYRVLIRSERIHRLAVPDQRLHRTLSEVGLT